MSGQRMRKRPALKTAAPRVATKNSNSSGPMRFTDLRSKPTVARGALKQKAAPATARHPMGFCAAGGAYPPGGG